MPGITPIYYFRNFEPGSDIKFEFDGLSIGGLSLLGRTTMSAVLTNPNLAFIQVTETSPELHFPEHEIGLGSKVTINVPGRDITGTCLARLCVAQGADVLYYDPSLVDQTKPQWCAPEHILQYLPVLYSHIAVNDTLLF